MSVILRHRELADAWDPEGSRMVPIRSTPTHLEILCCHYVSVSRISLFTMALLRNVAKLVCHLQNEELDFAPTLRERIVFYLTLNSQPLTSAW